MYRESEKKKLKYDTYHISRVRGIKKKYSFLPKFVIFTCVYIMWYSYNYIFVYIIIKTRMIS